MISIRLELDPDLKPRLEAGARLRGVSPSEVVSDAFRSHLDETPAKRACLDIANEVGVVGVYGDAPADPSVNEDCFKDFGVE